MNIKSETNRTKILITGATGLVGKKLVDLLLAKEYVVHYLTTSKEKIKQKENYKGFYWNPKTQEIDKQSFLGVSVIINLAGSTIAKRWTKKYQQEIIDSRVQSLQLLYHTLSSINHNVKNFISASAIGIYPSDYTKCYTETEIKIDDSFIGEVVKKWESTADTFSKLNISVTKVRIGLVLSNKGGALVKMIKPIKLGFGAALGNGKQQQSWIHIDDLVQIFHFVLKHQLEGVFNAVAPNPVTNKELTKAIAKELKRSLLLPNIPSVMLKLLLGKMSYLLLSSQKVSSQKIQEKGFHFQYKTISKALSNLL